MQAEVPSSYTVAWSGLGGQSAGRKAGFTLVEISVLVAIIAILLALLWPVFGSIQQKARLSQLVSHLRSVHVALHGFATDQQGRFPWADEGGRSWSYLCSPYVGEVFPLGDLNHARTANRSVFRDPLDQTFLISSDRAPRKTRNIALNGIFSLAVSGGRANGVAGRRLATIQYPSKLLLATTGAPAASGQEYAVPAMRVRYDNFTGPHADGLTRVPGMHYGVFVDGHVRPIPFAEMKAEAMKAAAGRSFLFDDRANNASGL